MRSGSFSLFMLLQLGCGSCSASGVLTPSQLEFLRGVADRGLDVMVRADDEVPLVNVPAALLALFAAIIFVLLLLVIGRCILSHFDMFPVCSLPADTSLHL